MSHLTFPSLQNTPLFAFSPLLTRFWEETPLTGPLYDIATLATEYLAQNKLFADTSGETGIDYAMLEERSQLLLNWVTAIEAVFTENLTKFDETFKKDDFKKLLHDMRRVYTYPLLTSLWLGLEHVADIINTEADTALYYRVQASPHYPNEIADECEQVLDALNDYGDIASLVRCLHAAQLNKPVTTKTLETFVVGVAPIVFRLAASGHQNLTAATLTILNHTLTWMDNIRMNQSYQGVVRDINHLRQNRVSRKEPIYATNDPIFDAHIPCGDVRINVDDPAYATGTTAIKKQAVGSDLSVVYAKLKANLELIVEYRGRLTQARTHRFLTALNDAVTSCELPRQKAHYCQCLIADWQRWMITQFGDKDVLMQECGSLGAALVAKIADSQGGSAHG